MQIRCPACEHSRTINTDKIPARAEFATCPKCSYRFRFRVLDGDDAAPPQPDKRRGDIWDAMDSLHAQWNKDKPNKQQDKPGAHDADARGPQEEERPIRDLGRLAEDGEHTDDSGADEGEFQSAAPVSAPWEQAGGANWAARFYRTMLLALLHPSHFYPGLSAAPPLTPAIIFYIIFGMFQHLCSSFWLKKFLDSMDVEQLAKLPPSVLQLTDFSNLPAMLLMLPFWLVFQLAFTAWLLHLCLRLLLPERARFVLTFKIASYASASSIFAAIPFVGVFSPFLYMLCLVIGYHHAYRLQWGKTCSVVLPLGIFVFILAFFSLGQTP